MRNHLFTINKKNAFDLKNEYGLSDYDTDYIYRNFWPIIILTDVSILEFQNKLNEEKTKFINERGKFVLSIFKRDYLDYLINELNEYLDNINSGKNKIYDFVNNTYFHWFKLKLDVYDYTLLLTNKDEIGLEIYLNDILDCINSFLSNYEALPPQPELSENDYAKAIEKLNTIWLAEPKISVEEFIQKGVAKGLWNENLKIITSRGSLYSTGKTLLSSIYFAFKDWAISSNTDYNEVGKAFCEVFNIEIKEATKEKYKAFSSGNPKIITEIKRTFGVK